MERQLKLFGNSTVVFLTEIRTQNGRQIIRVFYHSSLDDFDQALKYTRANYQLEKSAVLIALPREMKK
jgi:hypothetical protein